MKRAILFFIEFIFYFRDFSEYSGLKVNLKKQSTLRGLNPFDCLTCFFRTDVKSEASFFQSGSFRETPLSRRLLSGRIRLRLLLG